ncbi:flagellar basal body rod protein FlgB [Coprothermobacter platensis]|jgi:flagellar basal-body rod protein FlgB|uniref:flagellar basal body rod protein FlgB n=1 Tax=Coprothermobacter platensis TaxID=108819 RepID=UPI00036EADBE|nr:flagellar basal body rod protein FlgB [Coprothermobacter platensis]
MSIDLLKTMMGAVFQDLEVLQSNLANVNTPDYKRQEIDFSQVLQELQMNGNLTQPLSSFVKTDDTSSWKLDGNNVDPDKEIVNITETALWYQGITEMLSRHFATAREVLQMLR